jgi:DNA polymerase-3 subunit alpha
MASVLIHNSSNMDKITFFMEECRRMGIEILGPDVNESKMDFAVNQKGMIRFGLAAIKGVGESAVESIIEQRQKEGAFKTIFDFAARVNLRNVSRRVFESLALAGGFDGFEISRASYMEPVDTKNTLIELAMKYGNSIKAQEGSNQNSLFGGTEMGGDLMEPSFKKVEEYPVFARLSKEKELVGMYISGHPLDQFKYELKKLKYTPVSEFKSKPNGQDLILIGMIQNARQGISKKGNPYGAFQLVDYDGSEEIFLNGDRYLKWAHMFQNNNMVLIKGKNATRFSNSDQSEFQISQMELLNNVSEKMISGILLEMDVQEITEVLLSQLGEVVDRFPGTKDLKIKLYDTVKIVSLGLVSNGKKVDLSPAFYEEISKICQFDLMIRLN